MLNKRNSMDIIAEILKVAHDGAKKTHIVYKANLNFKVLEEYLEKMIDSGLVTILKEKRNLIKTTEKGVTYLKNYRGFMNYVESTIIV